eukprot:366461-Chlamydomonas_euryale.AAC.10
MSIAFVQWRGSNGSARRVRADPTAFPDRLGGDLPAAAGPRPTPDPIATLSTGRRGARRRQATFA